MTLPQHLEPYMTHDNPGLTRALQVNYAISFTYTNSDYGIDHDSSYEDI